MVYTVALQRTVYVTVSAFDVEDAEAKALGQADQIDWNSCLRPVTVASVTTEE